MVISTWLKVIHEIVNSELGQKVRKWAAKKSFDELRRRENEKNSSDDAYADKS